MLLHLLTAIAAQTSKVVPQVDLGHNESTYAIATWIMRLVYTILDFFELEHYSSLFTWLYAILVFVIALAVGYVVKWITMGCG